MNRSHQLTACILICITASKAFAGGAADDKATSQYAVSAYWVDLTEPYRKDYRPRVIRAPNLLFRIQKDGGQRMLATSGDINDRMSYGSVSTSSIKLHGDSIPVDADLEYEFKDNRNKHFVVKRAVTLKYKYGTIAFFTDDQRALLLLRWDPHKAAREVTGGFDGSPDRASVRTLTKAVLSSAASGVVFARISGKEGLADLQKMFRDIRFPLMSGQGGRRSDPMLALRIAADNKAIFEMALSSYGAVYCGLKAGVHYQYPLRGDQLIDEILAKHGDGVVEDERFLGGMFSVYRGMARSEPDPPERSNLLLLVQCGGLTHLAEFTIELAGTVEIRCDEDRERCWLVEIGERRIIAYFDREGAVSVGPNDEIPKWATPSSGRLLRRFSMGASRDR